MPLKTYRVEFFDANGMPLGECRAVYGSAAHPPKAPHPPKGWRFDHWEPEVCFVRSNLRSVAVYAPKEYLVTFMSETGTVLKREYVPYGGDATPPQYHACGRAARWSGPTQNIRRAETFRAQFEGAVA
ncbi:MAG: hypothetical protein LBG83_08155 [Oscillospiraceae bacterium]|nr:hypothetical protein [Oscillospiraceae bacterium]